MWQNFYDKFVEFGGEGFYGAWKLTYQEPLFKSGDYGDYDDGLCPVAERIQPYLMQFKTNYSDIEQINFQAEALDKTIRTFK
jgi:perosamine synthetase